MNRGYLGIWRQGLLGWAIALALLLGAVPMASAASAVQISHDESGGLFTKNLCHYVAPITEKLRDLPTQAFRCAGPPQGYQSGSLWLEIKPETAEFESLAPDIFVRQARFDALYVGYYYRDGRQHWQRVSSGDYGDHWRIGAQIAFTPDDRHQPVDRILLRFDRLADHASIYIRFMAREAAIQQNAITTAITTAAMMLMLISGLYSLGMARAQARKTSIYWQALWAFSMLAWAVLWSQAHLIILPDMAGLVSLKLGTILSCFCIAFATFAAVTAAKPEQQHFFYPKAAIAVAALIMLYSIPFAVIRAQRMGIYDNILAGLILLNIVLIVAALVYAIRKGSAEARSMLVAWCVPMGGLSLSSLVDMDLYLWGSGSKLLTLMSATWYALWLTISSARRLHAIAKERDKAQKLAEAAMRLAVRDSLTGLYNRRGFLDRAHSMLAKAKAEGRTAALLVIDVDWFKSVNDVYGHDVGDQMLCGVACSIEQWDGPSCISARIGGEEFAILLIGTSGMELRRFAEKVRRSIREWKPLQRIIDHPITASIGVAEAYPAVDFDTLYPAADHALYAAKHAGRDRVEIAQVDHAPWPVTTANQYARLGG